ncbi:hypothetical protein QFZ23_002183 [Arthrobacter globiformis]|uniref:hypothetical protein n=1 Tax=Arthrobacter globiformis TaxID=1665 RepID=UPI00278A1033|nr:hypothetical protein [Arthrobacter globiformis]MDQ1058282.1 hypothetical protein [Arthrobacter globiformis]
MAAPSHAAGAINLASLTGTVHIVLPPNPARVHTKLIQVSASNAQTSCKARGAEQFTLNTATETFTGSYPFTLPPNPVRVGLAASP